MIEYDNFNSKKYLSLKVIYIAFCQSTILWNYNKFLKANYVLTKNTYITLTVHMNRSFKNKIYGSKKILIQARHLVIIKISSL